MNPSRSLVKGVLSILGGAGIAVSVASGASAAVSIGFSEDVGPFSGPVATGATLATYGGGFGDFAVSVTTGTIGTGPTFGSQNLTQFSSSTNHTLNVFVTATDLTGPAPSGLQSFLSSFTSQLLPPGWTVTESTYFNANNLAFGQGTLLDKNVFQNIGTSVQSGNGSISGPYSLTEIYTISAVGVTGGAVQTALSNILVSATPAVPEASTWAMMLLGFLGVGTLAYRRKGSARALRLT